MLVGNTLICFGKEYNNIALEAQILSAEGGQHVQLGYSERCE
jgi:hypothetical protein